MISLNFLEVGVAGIMSRDGDLEFLFQSVAQE
jgi:hypothetical protein